MAGRGAGANGVKVSMHIMARILLFHSTKSACPCITNCSGGFLYRGGASQCLDEQCIQQKHRGGHQGVAEVCKETALEQEKILALAATIELSSHAPDFCAFHNYRLFVVTANTMQNIVTSKNPSVFVLLESKLSYKTLKMSKL